MGALGWSWYGCTCRNIGRPEAIWLRSWEAWSCFLWFSCICIYWDLFWYGFLRSLQSQFTSFVVWFFKGEEGPILWQDLTLGVSLFPWPVCLVSEILPRAQIPRSFEDATSLFSWNHSTTSLNFWSTVSLQYDYFSSRIIHPSTDRTFNFAPKTWVVGIWCQKCFPWFLLLGIPTCFPTYLAATAGSIARLDLTRGLEAMQLVLGAREVLRPAGDFLWEKGWGRVERVEVEIRNFLGGTNSYLEMDIYIYTYIYISMFFVDLFFFCDL